MTHILAAVFGIVLLYMILRSMIRIALMNCHSKDFFAEFTGRAVYTAAALRLRDNREANATHRVLLCFFPVYILSLIVVYFIGAMTAFAFLYWGIRAVGTWRQAFISSGSGLNTLGFATPTTIAGQWLSIPEGALGLGLVVFLFTFIPGYQTVIRAREDRTSWLYVRVGGSPHRRPVPRMVSTRRQGNGHDRRLGSVGRLVPNARRHTLGLADARNVAFGAERPVLGFSRGCCT
jgi:hypothetical protein